MPRASKREFLQGEVWTFLRAHGASTSLEVSLAIGRKPRATAQVLKRLEASGFAERLGRETVDMRSRRLWIARREFPPPDMRGANQVSLANLPRGWYRHSKCSFSACEESSKESKLSSEGAARRVPKLLSLADLLG